MYIIDVEFHSLDEVSVAACIGQIGAYVLWSDQAFARPSYIGEGVVLDRIMRHVNDREKPIPKDEPLGYVGLLTDGPRKKRKTDAEIVEATLLEAADMLGLAPRHNKASGKHASVWKRGFSNDTIRLNISGWHPLRFASKIQGTARLGWKYDSAFDEFFLDAMPWRRS